MTRKPDCPESADSISSTYDFYFSPAKLGKQSQECQESQERWRRGRAPCRIPFRSRKTSVVAPMQQKTLVLRLQRRRDVRRDALPLRGRLQFLAAAFPVRAHHVGDHAGLLQ